MGQDREKRYEGDSSNNNSTSDEDMSLAAI